MRARQEDSPVMLSTFAPLSVNSAKHLEGRWERPFAAAQGDNLFLHEGLYFEAESGRDPSLRLSACPERSEWGDNPG